MKITKSDILKLIENEKSDTVWNHFLHVLSIDYKPTGEIQNNQIKIWRQGIFIGAFYPVYTFELNSENQLIKISDKLNPIGKILYLMLPLGFSFLFFSNVFGDFEYKKSLISVGIILIFVFAYIFISRKIYRFEKKEQLKQIYSILNIK